MLIAMDKQTVRTVSKDGHLHVKVSHISKANVCPYKGAEIPNAEELRLDPDRVYNLWRHPEELKRAAPTFNNLPILSRHVPVTSADHPRELVVGSTGTDAAWNAPYLDNSLVIWDDEAIAGIESDEQRELSSAYHYIAEMTPGEIDGLRYDGIMRNIVGNHVALVEEGRAGPDVIVGDSKLEPPVMAKPLKSRKALMVAGAVRAYLAPRLATDAKPDLSAAFDGITRGNFKRRKQGLAKAIRVATTGKLAADASLDDVVELLDALDDVTDGEVDEDVISEAAETDAGDPEADKPLEDDPAATDADGDKIAQLLEFLKGKLSDEDLAAAMELAGASADEPDDSSDEPPAEDVGGECKEPKITGMAKPGMDAASVVRTIHAIREAERIVHPIVGEITVGMDSAAAVYRMALDAAKIDVKGVHPSAYRSLVEMHLRTRDTGARRREPALAQDSAERSSFAEAFPLAREPKRI